MKNFTFDYNGKTYWYSPSCTVGLFVYCKDASGDWCILANRRGPGCPNNVGKWNAPGGFLDFEKLEEAAVRECKEETGVILSKDQIKLFTVRSSEKSYNVSLAYYCILKGTTKDYPTSKKYMEENEVMDIEWIRVDDIDDYDWAFEHNKRIHFIFNKAVNPKGIDKINLKLSKLLDFDILYHYSKETKPMKLNNIKHKLLKLLSF